MDLQIIGPRDTGHHGEESRRYGCCDAGKVRESMVGGLHIGFLSADKAESHSH